MQATALCGRQSCPAIVPAGGLSGRRRTDRSRSSQVFFGFVFRRHPAAKTEKFVAYRKRWTGKTACRHDCLPHEWPKSKSRLKGGCRQDCLPHSASQLTAMNVQTPEPSAARPTGKVFCAFVFRRHRPAKPEKFVAYREGGLERPPAGTIACHTKGQGQRQQRRDQKLKRTPSVTRRLLAAPPPGPPGPPPPGPPPPKPVLTDVASRKYGLVMTP